MENNPLLGAHISIADGMMNALKICPRL